MYTSCATKLFVENSVEQNLINNFFDNLWVNQYAVVNCVLLGICQKNLSLIRGFNNLLYEGHLSLYRGELDFLQATSNSPMFFLGRFVKGE